jgi:hypothetical protein
MKKIDWFESEKKSFLKGTPKKDGSGGGMRLNKGRGGCPPKKQEEFGKGMDTERMLKTAVAFPIIAGGILVGTKLIKEIA